MDKSGSRKIKYSNLSDAQIMQLVIEGDQEAFGLIIKRYREKLGSFVTRYFWWDTELVRELVQKGFVRVYEKRDMYDSSQPFRPWIYRIFRNACLDERKRKKPKRLDNPASLMSDSPNPEQTYSRKQQREWAVELMKSLPPRQHEVISCIWQGMSYKEISQVLGLDESTVRHTTRNALKKLRLATRKIK